MNKSRESKRNGCDKTFDLYVGHVPKSVQQAALVEVFSKYGKVIDVLIRHSTGDYGYAIVKFKQKKEADKVLRQIDKIFVDNHEMEVRNGKRSVQSGENCNEIVMPKTVTFAEPCPSIHNLGSINITEAPMLVSDCMYPVYPGCESASIPVTVEIMCTNVENAVTFHGCCITNFEELQHLSIKLNSICPNLTRLVRKPIINRIYGAMYSADCQWYRCNVLRYGSSANSSTCIVEYIDFGNVAEVCYTNMVELPEPLQNLSPFAIKCFFSNLVPTGKSVNCVSYLHHLVNHRMSLCAMHTWGSPEYHVTKCSCNGIDVIAELVRNGYAMYKTQGSPKSITPPKMEKFSKFQECKRPKKASDKQKNKKDANICNETSKYSHDLKNGGITIQEKSDRSSFSAETHNFMPKKIIKRGSDTKIDCNPILEAKAVNHFLKVDSVVCNVKVINNIRSLIPLHSYDDLLNEAVDLLKSDMTIAPTSDSKQLVENAKKAYCEALREIKGCSDLNLLPELKEKRNQRRIELCNELEKFLESFDCTLLEKRKKIQETITALESNSTAWLNVYLPKIPETIEDLLVAFNKEKERKRKNIEMARKNTDDKREKFLKVYEDLGKEFSFNMVNTAPDDVYLVSSIGKKGSWALKFDEALTEFSIALEEERKISTVIEDRTYVSVIQYILEKLDIPKDKIDAECDVYEKFKSLYDDLMNSLDLNPIFDELHAVSETIKSFNSNSNYTNADELSEGCIKLHAALLREDSLLASVIKASAQHFPELIREHPELKLEEYQKYFCLLKLSWDTHFFPSLNKCNRVEPSYISNLGEEPVVIKEFIIPQDSENAFMKKVKMWSDIKSTSLVKIKGLFKSKHVSKKCDETSCIGKPETLEIQTEKQKVIHDENQNTVKMNGELEGTVEVNCQWIDCEAKFLTHDDLILHVREDHIEKNSSSFVCQWKGCSMEEKPFKTQNLFIDHMQKHIGEKSHSCTTQNVMYAVLVPAWKTLYDEPLLVPVDYKMALNILQQVLEGLCNIHSRGITHGAIHPMSILHEGGKVLLDFNVDKQLLKDKICLNGINFQVPKEELLKSVDMYGFGCLILWVLFPNLSFQSTDKGVPNISAFQSIIESMLFPKDFASLCSLFNENSNLRATARMLRSNGFLKNLRIMSESSSS